MAFSAVDQSSLAVDENSAIAQYHSIEITVKMVSKCAKMSIRYDAIRDAKLGTRQRASYDSINSEA